MIVLDSNSSLFPMLFFKLELAQHSLARAKRHLILYQDGSGSGIFEDGTAMVAIVLRFSPISTGQSAWNNNIELIGRHKIPWLMIVDREESFFLLDSL